MALLLHSAPLAACKFKILLLTWCSTVPAIKEHSHAIAMQHDCCIVAEEPTTQYNSTNCHYSLTDPWIVQDLLWYNRRSFNGCQGSDQ